MKQALRQEFRRLRDCCSPEERESKSVKIGKRLFALSAFKKAKTVLFYASFQSEVETKPLIEKALKLGKQVFLPRVEGKKLALCGVNSLSELSQGSFGIPEPCKNALPSFEKPEIIIVPGIAFDLQGNRLGFGKGFYDRLLQKTKALKIGLAFDCQVIERIPSEKHDIKVDLLLTEKRTCRFKE